jgi:16S rRNA (guanine(1405)-N(7))-methyltransferase
MNAHASARERLPFLAPFYQRIFAQLGPVRRVLDLGCGLNPLAIPWMPLAADAVYHAYDVHGDLVQFLAAALPLLGVAGTARLSDLAQDVIDQPADLALLLKLLPTLEQLDRTAGDRLLTRLNAQHMVVSFPIRSLGGREKGMRTTYETRFRHMIADRPWQVERLEFPTELVFVVTT